MDALAVALAGAGGLAFGSFLNVVVHRVPRRQSVVSPGSRCPACDHPLGPADNIPLVSWLLLGGRCRYCAAPISARSPAGELTTAVVWVLGVLRLGVSWDLLAFLPFLWVLVALSLIDLEHKILPNSIVYPSVAAGAALLAVSAALGPGMQAWLRAVEAGGAGAGGFLLVALIAPAGMGMGDVKLAGLIGLFLGYQSWTRVALGFFLAFLTGAVTGVALMVAGRAGRKTAIPFGPFMALGSILSALFGGPLLRAVGR